MTRQTTITQERQTLIPSPPRLTMLPPVSTRLCAFVVALIIISIEGTRANPTRVQIRREGLTPRASPQPCAQRYVCPEPRPYPNLPDTSDDPGPTRFKCRIGSSVSDPNFAFCIYEKDTGNLVGATPAGIQSLCWERGMPNPACVESTGRRRGVPMRPQLDEGSAGGEAVIMERFSKARKSSAV